MSDTVRSLLEAGLPGTTFTDTDTAYLERTEVPVGAVGTTLRDNVERIFPGEVFDDSVLVVQTDTRAMADAVADPAPPPDPYSDTFDADLSKWTLVTDDVALDGLGHLALPTTLTDTGAAKTHAATLATSRSLAGKAARVEWESIALPASGMKSAGIKIARLNNPANYYVLVQESGGSILFRTYAFGATSATVAYDAATDRNWRVRDDGTSVLFETSPDGATWTQKASLPRPTWLDEEATYQVYQNVSSTTGVSPDATLVDSFAVA